MRGGAPGCGVGPHHGRHGQSPQGASTSGPWSLPGWPLRAGPIGTGLRTAHSARPAGHLAALGAPGLTPAAPTGGCRACCPFHQRLREIQCLPQATQPGQAPRQEPHRPDRGAGTPEAMPSSWAAANRPSRPSEPQFPLLSQRAKDGRTVKGMRQLGQHHRPRRPALCAHTGPDGAERGFPRRRER